MKLQTTFLSFLFLLWTTSTLASSSHKATVYLIRQGEKPSDGGVGLSPAGSERAQCLRGVFSASSSYNIGYIMAQTPKSGKYP
jgi:hypothetical protein